MALPYGDPSFRLLQPTLSLTSTRSTALRATTADESTSTSTIKKNFDLATALFCGGLAFDSYVEPPANSSRWEKGPQGMKVAFVSPVYTRNLYKGIVEITVKRVTGLPEDDGNGMERLVSGRGKLSLIWYSKLLKR